MSVSKSFVCKEWICCGKKTIILWPTAFVVVFLDICLDLFLIIFHLYSAFHEAEYMYGTEPPFTIQDFIGISKSRRCDVQVRPLQWRHNERNSVSNHQPHDCLLNCLTRRRSKKTTTLRVTGLCAGNSPGTGEFPAQMASNEENVSIWWRHHAIIISERDDVGLTDMQAPFLFALWWGHNWCDGVSNHRHLDCLLNRLFRGRSKKTSKIRITGLYEGNSPVTGEFPAQKTSNAERVSIWWRNHGWGQIVQSYFYFWGYLI